MREPTEITPYVTKASGLWCPECQTATAFEVAAVRTLEGDPTEVVDRRTMVFCIECDWERNGEGWDDD